MSLRMNAAFYFIDLGYPVLPCSPGTLTLLPYFCVCDATLRPKVVRRWWSEWPDANLAIRTDDVVVFDVATKEALSQFDKLDPPAQKIPGGGFQVFFRRPVRKRPPKWPGVKSGSRNYVVVGPSYTPAGMIEWIRPLWALSTLPDWAALETLLYEEPQKPELGERQNEDAFFGRS